jgi:hypothetical protein
VFATLHLMVYLHHAVVVVDFGTIRPCNEVSVKACIGPFTHTVDDGIPLRKAALSISSRSWSNCPVSDIQASCPSLVRVQGDAEDGYSAACFIRLSPCSRR